MDKNDKYLLEVTKDIQELIGLRSNPVLLLKLRPVGYPALYDLLDELKDIKNKKIDVLLDTFGGNIDAAYQITKVLQRRFDEVNIIVPFIAKSAGTLICLGADNLYLNDLSELGPLDAQISEHRDGTSKEHISALNGFKALEQIQQHNLETTMHLSDFFQSILELKLSDSIKLSNDFCGHTCSKLYEKLDPYKIGEYARHLEVAQKYGFQILTRYMNWNRNTAENTVKRLVKDYPSHNFILDNDELLELNLPVKELSKEEANLIDKIRMPLFSLNETFVKLFQLSDKSSSNGKNSVSTAEMEPQ